MSYNANHPGHGQIQQKPTGVAHKALFLLPFADKDGKYTDGPNGTDAQYLDVGFSQWDPNDLSVKVWRRAEDRWSRQSEEVPVHRVLDMAQLVLQVLIHRDEKDRVTIPANVFEGQDEPLALAPEKVKFPPGAKVRNIPNYFIHEPKELDRIKQRLHALRNQLNDAFQAGNGDFQIS